MEFVNKSPGVYVPETATPPSVVPEVTISRLMMIGTLPWTDPEQPDRRTWACSSWRDIMNEAHRLDPTLGPAAVLELCQNLSWNNAGQPTSKLDKSAGNKLLGGEVPANLEPAVGQKGTDTGQLNAGQIALTLIALRTYFDHGGSSAIVFHPRTDGDAGDEFNQKLLQDHDIGIVCAPGRSKAFYKKLRDVCGTRDSDPDGDAFCFLLIDAPRNTSATTEFFDKQYDLASHSSACFGPWLRQKNPVGQWVEIPPSPAVAGAFAACDSAYGPYRAAAGLQFTIKGNWELTSRLSDTEAGVENEKGRNQLRQFGQGQSPVIWGARTLSENVDLQYIPVARVLLTLRKAIKRALRSFVFHPNNLELRQWVYRMLYGYLEDRRRRGWLKGTSADEAFAITFPTSVDDEKKGLLRVRVEVALARPAEFIEVEITQIQELTV